MAPLLNSIIYLKNNADSSQTLPKNKEHIPTHSMNSILSKYQSQTDIAKKENQWTNIPHEYKHIKFQLED